MNPPSPQPIQSEDQEMPSSSSQSYLQLQNQIKDNFNGIILIDGKKCFNLDFFLNPSNQEQEGALLEALPQPPQNALPIQDNESKQVLSQPFANPSNNFFNDWEWKDIFQEIMSEPSLSDLTLKVGRDGVRIPVLKNILMWRCKYFNNLFSCPTIRQKHLRLESFLRDFEPNVFCHFLKYIYTGELKSRIPDTYIMQLIDLSAEFKTEELFNRCVELLKLRIKIENVVHLLKYLGEPAFKFILENAEKIFKTDGFLNLDIHFFVKLLRSDLLNCPEIKIFEAVLRWATKKKEQRIMEDLASQEMKSKIIPLIRFPLMSAQEIAEKVHPTRILDNEELSQLYHYVSVVSPEMKPKITKFSTKPRIWGLSQFPYAALNTTVNESFAAEQEFVNDLSSDLRIINCFSVKSITPATSVECQEANTSVSDVIASTSTRTPTKKSKQVVSFSNNTHEHSKQEKDENYSDSSSSDDFNRVQILQNDSIDSWDGYLRKWKNSDKSICESLTLIKMENVSVGPIYPKIVMPQIEQLLIDINIDLSDNFARFVSVFDLRRYIFFTKNANRPWKFEELWNMRTPITIIINGVTLFRISKIDKELTISFRNDANEIMAGLGKSDQLLKLSLLKSDLPDFIDFPTKYLQQIVFYKVGTCNENDVGEFIRKCSNLVELSCYAVVIGGHRPSLLDLTKNLTSGNKLEHLAIFYTVLNFSSSPLPVKSGMSQLYLDRCFWVPNFPDQIHLLFPNLTKIAIRQRVGERLPLIKGSDASSNSSKGLIEPPLSYFVTARMLLNILKIKSLQWIWIWGMNWEERADNQSSSPLKKNLRNRPGPITDEEIAMAQSFLERCGLRFGVYNFILTKIQGPLSEFEDEHQWEGKELNEKEPKEDDFGFWDMSDRSEFESFRLNKFFKNHVVFQENFE